MVKAKYAFHLEMEDSHQTCILGDEGCLPSGHRVQELEFGNVPLCCTLNFSKSFL